ncbi:hypothetical protein Patl1_22108 [Pistacia atlantica]|uniref:Uncharacterized protein n=1 Tax=Pistacia atlantica TaxID=434234 RepID=A0ACC1BJH3_9ROSI|nr:hypothetical protein Patl1_22108 [Pistacia atlantica]
MVKRWSRAPSLEEEIERAMLACQKGRDNAAMAIVKAAEKCHLVMAVSSEVKKTSAEIVDDESVEMIVNCLWKPVDIAPATEIVLDDINVELAFCNDHHCYELLEEIRDMFQLLLKHGSPELEKILNCLKSLAEGDVQRRLLMSRSGETVFLSLNKYEQQLSNERPYDYQSITLLLLISTRKPTP